MGWSVVKQPNGKYAIWSTIAGDFIVIDGSAEDVKQAFQEQYYKMADRTADEAIQRAEGKKVPAPRHTFKECVEALEDKDPDDRDEACYREAVRILNGGMG